MNIPITPKATQIVPPAIKIYFIKDPRGMPLNQEQAFYACSDMFMERESYYFTNAALLRYSALF